MESCLYDYQYEFVPWWYSSLFQDVWISFSVYIVNFEKTALKGCENVGINVHVVSETGSILGHIVSEEAHHWNLDHMRQVNTYDIREFWQLLKLMGYFRQHVDNFGKIAKPFYNLLKKLYIKGQVIPSPVAFSLQVVHQAELERLNHLF